MTQTVTARIPSTGIRAMKARKQKKQKEKTENRN
jgi:hypothetical protein